MQTTLPERAALAIGLTFAMALVAIALSGPSAARADDDATRAKATDLGWLAGGWRTEDGGIEEYWSPPASGMLIGMARFKSRDGGIGMTELMTIAPGKDGAGLVYNVRHFTVALSDHPAGAAAFGLAETGENKAVFVLPENDFPSKITYAREGEKLVITLEGEQGGRPVRQQIPMTRVPLPGR